MQDQLTGGQTNLQQPRTDLQPVAPSLQQNGTQTGGNATTLLSQPPTTTQLQVQSTGQSTANPTQNMPDDGGNFLMLAFIMFPIVVALALLQPGKRKPLTTTTLAVQTEPKNLPQPPKSKTKKKTGKRKKSSKR